MFLLCKFSQSGLTTYLISIFSIPFLQQCNIITHSFQHSGQLCQFVRWNLRGYRSVAVLLTSEIYEVWAHAVLLASAQLVHAESGGHMLVRHLVPDPPSHVNNLELQSVPLLAVVLNFGVDPLHQCVSLHQHIRKGWTSKYPDNLKYIQVELYWISWNISWPLEIYLGWNISGLNYSEYPEIYPGWTIVNILKYIRVEL